jgi:hypothetical protein
VFPGGRSNNVSDHLRRLASRQARWRSDSVPPQDIDLFVGWRSATPVGVTGYKSFSIGPPGTYEIVGEIDCCFSIGCAMEQSHRGTGRFHLYVPRIEEVPLHKEGLIARQKQPIAPGDNMPGVRGEIG